MWPNLLAFGLLISGLYIALAFLLKQATEDIGKGMAFSALKSEYVEFMVEIQPGHFTTCHQMLSKVTSEHEPKGRFEFTYVDALKFLEFLDERVTMPNAAPGHLALVAARAHQKQEKEKDEKKIDVESNPVLVE